METTSESEAEAVVSSDPTRQQEIEDLRRRLEAKDRKIAYLESFLNQKLETTRKNYQDLKPYFDSQKDKIMQLFFKNFPCRLDYDQIIELFQKKHPQIPVTNLPRRIKEMVQEQRLVSSYDQERGKVIFHLKLFPQDDKVNGENVKRSDGHKESCGENESK